jgi:phosphohistidine phosphatase
MALFLVQHGISASKDVDSEKELTSQGRVETERIAKVATGYGIKVGRIVHSGKKRAEQTASIYHHALSLKSPLEVVAGINPLDDVQSFATTINPGLNLMVVGHMPFMQRLVSYLTTGSETIQVNQFQNSGTVCLSANEKPDGEFNWFMKWTLNPNIS